MNKVITINLNNNAYQLEESGYEALRKYLDQAEAKLAANPDKDEIIADLEQAIADKCAKYLDARKNVVTSQEVDEILKAMGPVQADEAEGEAEAKTASAPTNAPKRLFKIREGAIFEGVCNGLAAYSDLDATVVRVAFILLTILTGGAWIIAYILMAIFIPEARTREDVAAAQGRPYNAQTVMENARERYEYWKEFGHEQAKHWKEWEEKDREYWKQYKAEQIANKYTKKYSKYMPSPEELEKLQNASIGNRIARGVAGWFGGIGVLVLIGLTVLLALGLYAAATHGAVLGYFVGASLWLLVGLLVCLYLLVFLPLQGIVSTALSYAEGRKEYTYFWGKFFTSLIWVAALVGVIVLVANSHPIHDGMVQARDDIFQLHRIGR